MKRVSSGSICFFPVGAFRFDLRLPIDPGPASSYQHELDKDDEGRQDDDGLTSGAEEERMGKGRERTGVDRRPAGEEVDPVAVCGASELAISDKAKHPIRKIEQWLQFLSIRQSVSSITMDFGSKCEPIDWAQDAVMKCGGAQRQGCFLLPSAVWLGGPRSD